MSSKWMLWSSRLTVFTVFSITPINLITLVSYNDAWALHVVLHKAAFLKICYQVHFAILSNFTRTSNTSIHFCQICQNIALACLVLRTINDTGFTFVRLACAGPWSRQKYHSGCMRDDQYFFNAFSYNAYYLIHCNMGIIIFAIC